MDPAPDRTGAPGALSLDDLGREAEHLLRYRVEIDRRLVERGVGSIDDLVALYDQMRGALGDLSSEEIAWMQDRIERLVERLEEHARGLAQIRDLKLQISG
jgi:hypothetical protein